MQTLIALGLVTLGGALYALHTWICHKRECASFSNGYMQAQKEHKIRQEAVDQYKAQLRPIVPQGVEEKGEDLFKGFPPEFMDEVRKGRAVVRLK